MKDFPFESAGLPRDHGARNDGAAPITQGRGAQPVAASLSPDGQGADGVRAPAVKTERHPFAPPRRSEERRGGKEWGSTCSYRWAPEAHKKKQYKIIYKPKQ